MSRPLDHDYIETMPSTRAFFARHRHIFWRHEPAWSHPAYEHVWEGERWARNLRQWLARPLTPREFGLLFFMWYCAFGVLLVSIGLFDW